MDDNKIKIKQEKEHSQKHSNGILIHETSKFIQGKNIFIFWLVIYSCFLYPIEFQERTLHEIDELTNLEVSSFNLPRDIEYHLHLWLFKIDLKYNHLSLQLFIFEMFFLFDIIINLFVIREEDVLKHDKHIDDISITAQSYLNDGFWFDFLVWFPWGHVMAWVVHEDFHVLNFVRCFRLIVIRKFLNEQTIKEKCDQLFDKRFLQILKDPIKRVDFRNNRTMIESRMLTKNIAIAFKILFYTMLALYFTGNYWLCFSLIFFTWNRYENVDNYFIASQLALPYE